MKKKVPSLINIQSEILISVDGEEEKTHTLSWDVLKRIGDSTQKLISTLAKASLIGNPIDPEYTKLVFTGFYPGSAVPAFKVVQPPNLLFPITNEIKELNAEVSSVVKAISVGNFQAIADKYNEPSLKNAVVDAVYEFTNSAGSRPLRIVKRKPSGPGFKQLAKIRVMTHEQKSLLRVGTPQSAPIAGNDTAPIEAVGKFTLNKTKTGKTTKKNLTVYTQKEASLALKFDSIETDKRIYVLRGEVAFMITEDTKKFVNIECPLLDIYASGATIPEAELDIFSQFDYTYQRLNGIDDDKLSDHLLTAKKYINLIVDYVKDK